MTTIELVKISTLTLLERNPRTITKEQMEKLCKSIEDDPDFLWNRPVLVNKTTVSWRDHSGTNSKETLTVYAGNQRVRAAKKLKMKEIPCIIENDLCEERMKKRTVLDNKTFGEFDFDELANSFELEMLLDCGFKPEEILGDLSNICDDERDNDQDDVLEPTKDPKTKYGDLYELGAHRIKCGDSTNPDDVVDLLAGAIPILMVTDPPYGVNYDPDWRGKAGKCQKASGKVQNDGQTDWSKAWGLFPGQVAYVWCASWYLTDVSNDLDKFEFERKSLIIWVKQNFALSRGDYHWQHEPCWYAVRKGGKHNWQGSRKESTVWEISNLNAFGGKQEEGEERTCHSTQKPIECMARPIRNNSAEGEGVYDPFLGSGTTLIACEKLNRICYGLEIDPAYCDVIVDRWCKLTGKKAKRNGVEIDEL